MRGWSMADIDLAAVERELRARHDELEERLAALARPPERGSTVGFGKRIGDGTTEAVSRLTDVGGGGSLELSEARAARVRVRRARGPARTGEHAGGAGAGGSRSRQPVWPPRPRACSASSARAA